jgi:hypothetical protein
VTPVAKPPSWIEVLAALALIEAWVRGTLLLLKERFPAQADLLDKLSATLAITSASLGALRAVVTELQVLVGGEGPVDHDPVDHA